MKLVTFLHNRQELVGILEDSAVRPLPYRDMLSLIEAAPAQDVLRSAAQTAIPLPQIRLLAPIPRPRQDVICLGINYQAHAEEAERYNGEAFWKERPVPIYFSKRVTEAVGPGGVIPRHKDLVERLDYEAELAVILGRTARNVRPEEADRYVFGYTILNDVSARDVQTAHKQWYFGKSLDGFTPMGPCILTAEETAFPPALEISSTVNGELRQKANTSMLITSLPEILAELSSGMTLLPGTVIATGTPAGVGMGFDPPKFLETGDVVACSVQGIGTLENPVE